MLQVRDINDLTWGRFLESFVPKRLIVLVMKDILFCCLVICNFLRVFLWFRVVLALLFGLAPIIVVKYEAWKNLNRNTNKLQFNNPPVEQYSQGLSPFPQYRSKA